MLRSVGPLLSPSRGLSSPRVLTGDMMIFAAAQDYNERSFPRERVAGFAHATGVEAELGQVVARALGKHGKHSKGFLANLFGNGEDEEMDAPGVEAGEGTTTPAIKPLGKDNIDKSAPENRDRSAGGAYGGSKSPGSESPGIEGAPKSNGESPNSNNILFREEGKNQARLGQLATLLLLC